MSDNNSYPFQYRYRRIVDAKRYIDRNYEKKIDLEDIADEAHFSKYHFLRLFKQAYGKTPLEYLTNKRISEACKLLESDLSITRVCHKVGFSSLPSFSSLFKNEIGVYPSMYRSRVKSEKNSRTNNPLMAVPGCFAKEYKYLDAQSNIE